VWKEFRQPNFDDSAVQAVPRASPFPPPPNRFQSVTFVCCLLRHDQGHPVGAEKTPSQVIEIVNISWQMTNQALECNIGSYSSMTETGENAAFKITAAQTAG